MRSQLFLVLQCYLNFELLEITVCKNEGSPLTKRIIFDCSDTTEIPELIYHPVT